MIQTYSLAFIPNKVIIDFVKEMKQKLATEIGWFHSKNAMAHITVCEFKIEESALPMIEQQIIQIANGIKPVTAVLESFDSYPNGAFFISPNKASKQELKDIMKLFTTRLKVPNPYKSNDPHLSIARKLDSQKLAIANSLLTSKPLSFNCNSISLRKLNLEVKQFEIINTFYFKNEGFNEGIQTSLF
ncbi:2'-5' RNA ligase family protein [Flavobacterium jejuense]|uniref:2'-5' RNA ligase family protein n=1 Tax=Flavobacterium jejuense TaxID=1544455 RepID=A0ABX0IPE7_9FLAO|nr:2'-5' RNA ligase family protein [Flavobacterium jejuense]NHN24940.1 2'-5' RNA ligase family protein [Flavobacterium jejuense]